jgi:methylenetetrahydrofolate dehydrogenase (NADP+)/methenyltetrahydrofolate cyclohydrolase
MLLKGDVVVAEIEEGLKNKIAELKEHDVFPTMALVRVGERFSDIAYEASIVRACEAMEFRPGCSDLLLMCVRSS